MFCWYLSLFFIKNIIFISFFDKASNFRSKLLTVRNRKLSNWWTAWMCPLGFICFLYVENNEYGERALIIESSESCVDFHRIRAHTCNTCLHVILYLKVFSVASHEIIEKSRKISERVSQRFLNRHGLRRFSATSGESLKYCDFTNFADQRVPKIYSTVLNYQYYYRYYRFISLGPKSSFFPIKN